MSLPPILPTPPGSKTSASRTSSFRTKDLLESSQASSSNDMLTFSRITSPRATGPTMQQHQHQHLDEPASPAKTARRQRQQSPPQFVQPERFIVPSSPKQKRVPKPERKLATSFPDEEDLRKQQLRAAELHQAMQENEETIARGRKRLEEVFGRGDLSPNEALREAHKRARDKEREARKRRERFNKKGTERQQVSVPTGLTPPPSIVVAKKRDAQKREEEAKSKKRPMEESVATSNTSDFIPVCPPLRLPQLKKAFGPANTKPALTKRDKLREKLRDSRRSATQRAVPKDDAGLPVLREQDHAGAFLHERIGLLRQDEKLQQSFVKRCNARIKEMKLKQEQRWERIDKQLSHHIEERSVGTERYFREAALKHADHINTVREQHHCKLVEGEQVLTDQIQAHTARAQQAEISHTKQLYQKKLANDWIRLILVSRAFVVMRHHANAKLKVMKERWRPFLVVAAAGHWKGFTIRRKVERERDLKRVGLLVRQRMPEHVERTRIKRYRPHIDLLRKFLGDTLVVTGFSRKLSRHLEAVRKVQRWVRRFLRGRALWRLAILSSWEKHLSSSAMRCYNDIYPEHTVAESSFLRKSKSNVFIPSEVKHSSLIKAVVVELREQEEAHRQAIEHHGLGKIKSGQLISLLNARDYKGEIKPRRQPHLVCYVPQSFRMKVVRELVKKAAAQHVRRLLSHDRRLHQALFHEGLLDDDMSSVSMGNHPANGTRAAILGQKQKLRAKEQAERKQAFIEQFLRDDPKPVLETFVDSRNIARLSHLVETHCLQHRLRCEMEAQEEAQRQADLNKALGRPDHTFLTAGFMSHDADHATPQETASLGDITLQSTMAFEQRMMQMEADAKYEPFPDSPTAQQSFQVARALESFSTGQTFAFDVSCSGGGSPLSPNRQRRLNKSTEGENRNAEDEERNPPLSDFDVAAEKNSLNDVEVDALVNIMASEFMVPAPLPQDLSFIQAFVEGY